MLHGIRAKTASNGGNNSASPIVIYGRNFINETVTGTISPVILTYNIPINPQVDTFTANDVFSLLVRRQISSSADDKILDVYLGPTPGSLAGATRVATHNNISAGAFATAIRRSLPFYNNSLTTMRVMNLGISATPNDEAIQAMVAWQNVTVPNFSNISAPVYMMFVFTNEIIGQSQTLDMVQLIHYKR